MDEWSDGGGWSDSISDAASGVTDTVTGNDTWGGDTPSSDPGWLGSGTTPDTDPVAEANAAYDTLMAVSGGANWANQGVTGTGEFAALPSVTETGVTAPPPTGTGGVTTRVNADGTISVLENGREMGRVDNSALAQELVDRYTNSGIPRNETFEFNYGDTRRTGQYDQWGMPIWNWAGSLVNAPAPGKDFMSEEEWNAANPHYQAQTGWTPYWGYNEYLAGINPMLPALEQIYGQSWGGLKNAPDWITQNPSGSPYNALTYYSPPPVVEGHPDYERMMRDITKYGETFRVGGPSYTLPGGWMTMGPGGFQNTGLLHLKEENPSWYIQRMEGMGYVWNPYGGFFEQGYYGPAMGEPGSNRPYAYQQANIPTRRGGGGGGGGGSYTPSPVPPLELRPGTPEYEAYFSRLPRINNVEWMPGR